MKKPSHIFWWKNRAGKLFSFSMILIPEELFSRTFAGANFQGLKLKKVYKFYQIFQLLPGLEFCEDPVHTIKCELLYFDNVLFDKLHHLFGLS